MTRCWSEREWWQWRRRRWWFWLKNTPSLSCKVKHPESVFNRISLLERHHCAILWYILYTKQGEVNVIEKIAWWTGSGNYYTTLRRMGGLTAARKQQYQGRMRKALLKKIMNRNDCSFCPLSSEFCLRFIIIADSFIHSFTRRSATFSTLWNAMERPSSLSSSHTRPCSTFSLSSPHQRIFLFF